MQQGRSLLSLDSRALFSVAYAMLMDLAFDGEGRDKIKETLRGVEVDEETGMPPLPSWAVPADQWGR